MMNRRDALRALLALPFSYAQLSPAEGASYEMSVEGYIFQQYAQRNKKRLSDVHPGGASDGSSSGIPQRGTEHRLLCT